MIGVPAIRTSGLGSVSVIGRSRWPRPAASTMARRGMMTLASGTIGLLV